VPAKLHYILEQWANKWGMQFNPGKCNSNCVCTPPIVVIRESGLTITELELDNTGWFHSRAGKNRGFFKEKVVSFL